MNEYLKKYIELKKQFSAADGGPDSVRAFYGFKGELEQSGDRQAKEVLVSYDESRYLFGNKWYTTYRY